MSAIVSGEFGALLTTVTVPVALPVVVGANCAVKVAACPALIVNGAAIPLMLKPAPEAETWEMVRLADPLFVSVTVWEPVLPVSTEPNVTADGLAPSWLAVPVPDIVIVAGDPAALLTTEMVPVALPADVGAKVALNEALDPGLMVIGVAGPLTL